MCKAKYQSDDLLDMISTTVRKMNQVRGDLRMQVLLTSVRKTLKSELNKKQRNLKRKYNVILSAMNAKQEALKTKQDDSAAVLDSMQREPESQEDILGLDDFFGSLKRVKSSNDSNHC